MTQVMEKKTNIPTRARRKLRTPGPLTWIAIAITVIAFVAFISVSMSRNTSDTVIIALAIMITILTTLTAHYDQKARKKKTSEILESHNFVPCEKNEIEEDLVMAYRELKPIKLKHSSIQLILNGVFNDHEVFVANHVVGHGKYKQHYSSCAIWTEHKWPQTIIRPHKISDKLSKRTNLGCSRFDEQRELRSEDQSLATSILLPLADWFVVERHKSMSFRLHEVPGTKEQWSFQGHWIVLMDHGRMDAEGLVKMAEFLTAFAQQLNNPSLKSIS
jgi:hypothetical protein